MDDANVVARLLVAALGAAVVIAAAVNGANPLKLDQRPSIARLCFAIRKGRR